MLGFIVSFPPHTPLRLKELCGQAKIYIRLLQQDIPVADAGGDDGEEIMNDHDIPLVDCFSCGASVKMTDMQQHQVAHSQSVQVVKPSVDEVKEMSASEDVLDLSADIDSNWEPPPMLQPSKQHHHHQQQQQNGGSPFTVSDCEDEEQPGPSTRTSTVEQNLSVIFPGIPAHIIHNAILTYGSAERAVTALLNYRSTEESAGDGMCTWDTGEAPGSESSGTLLQVLQRLRSKMHARGLRDKIKVDADDQVMDVYSYYKSPYFDPLTPVSMVVKGQPAINIDSGGVLRQVFSEVFLSISNNEGGIKNVFTGEDFRKVPVFSNEAVVNGFFEVLGRMIAHSLVQCGPGFPYLAPSIYWYLATGDLQVALGKASRSDVSNKDLDMYIDQISEAPDEELAALTSQSDFLQLLIEAGETRNVTPENKLDVLQSLILHDILVKKKAIIDQFRKGLSTLGLLKAMEKNPSLFEECFLHNGMVTQESVASCLHFPDSEEPDNQRIFQMLQDFVQNSSAEDLQDFLKFITGSHTASSATLPYHISVSCHESDSIFASTCLLQLKLPTYFTSYAEFEAAMKAVIKGKGSSFTTG